VRHARGARSSRFEKRCGVLRGKLQGPNANSSMPHEGRHGLLVWQVRLRPHLRTEQEGWRRVGESCSADLGRMTNPAWILMVARSLVATVLDYCALRAVIFDSRRQPRKTEGNDCVVGYSAPSWLCLSPLYSSGLRNRRSDQPPRGLVGHLDLNQTIDLNYLTRDLRFPLLRLALIHWYSLTNMPTRQIHPYSCLCMLRGDAANQLAVVQINCLVQIKVPD
jgi:hypothetical protein